MSTVCLVVLSALALACGASLSSEAVPADDAHSDGGSMGDLRQRLAGHDVLLLQLQSTLAGQDRLLRLQAAKLTQQEELLRQQATKQTEQEIQLRQQAAKQTEQETQLRQQAAKQTEQETQLRQQAAKQTQQDSVLRQQTVKLNQQESLLDQQRTKLAQQEATLGHQEQTLLHQRRLLERLQSDRGLPTGDDESTDRGLDYSQGNTPTTEQGSRELPSSPDSVWRRADDQGPIEAVVEQMGRQLTQVEADVQALQHIPTALGSTFVHWGSSQCTAASSQLVYSGVVGGSHEDHPGGGTNYLCLSLSPVHSNHTIPSARAYLYGGEYETYDTHYQKDPVCAVCRSSLSTTIMTPGTNVCPADWHLDYSGFLMAGYYNQAAGSEYICVDSKMESRLGGDNNLNGMLLYYTVTRCGSLPCEPYVNNEVVTCAVCSR